jgi:hypothetical protein
MICARSRAGVGVSGERSPAKAKCSKFESLHPEVQIFLSFATGLPALLRMKENLRLEGRSDPDRLLGAL